MTIRWGFLGAGSIASSSLGPAVRAARGNALHAVASRDERRAAALGPQRTYHEYAHLLEDPDVDAVYVCLHNNAHLQWVVAALEHGKHVLCEKPLGLTQAEVADMAAAAAASQRLLVEAAWNRWHPRTRAAEELLAAGVLGQIQHVTARFNGATPAVGNYRRDTALGGGALWDVGCYAIAGALPAMGWQTPTAVRATMTYWAGSDGGDADVATEAWLAFGQTATAHITAALDGRDEQFLEVRGSQGLLRLPHPAFTAGTHPTALHLAVDGQSPREINYPATDPYRLMVEAFGKAIRDESTWLVPLEQSAAVARTIDDVRYASGAAVSRPIPPFRPPRQAPARR
ncbi:Gfo/Idh/MocA family protein [Planosporangium sp. 12N6]|uniref:Gfo/Idh/MocA family protein n=1 Tax=Planosporangium spinosum TaxID=3402278 RepID=UPI003CE6F55F